MSRSASPNRLKPSAATAIATPGAATHQGLRNMNCRASAIISPHSVEGGCALAVGLGRFEVVTPARLAEQFGDAAPGPGDRSDMMAGLVFRTVSVDQAEAALAAGGITAQRHGARIVVPADQAFGAVLAFEG